MTIISLVYLCATVHFYPPTPIRVGDIAISLASVCRSVDESLSLHKLTLCPSRNFDIFIVFGRYLYQLKTVCHM